MSLFSNFPQGGKKAGVQSISDGGTGATTAEAALANLGGFPKADGEALKTRIQPINLGGTGASEANQARQNLGAAAVKEMTKAEYDALPAIDPTIFYALTDVEAEGVKIEVGSYVGTGKYGSSNKNSITFGFEPKLVIVGASKQSNGTQGYFLNPNSPGWSNSFLWVEGQTYSLVASNDVAFTKSGKTLSWYSEKVGPQCNNSAVPYFYIAIG